MDSVLYTFVNIHTAYFFKLEISKCFYLYVFWWTIQFGRDVNFSLNEKCHGD